MKIWLAIISFLLAYNLWPYAWQGFYYQAMATGIFFIFWQLKNTGIAGKIGFWFAINNLLDELFFDPQKFQFNEYLFAIIISIHILCQAFPHPTTISSPK
jgi:hypothetical protein